MHVRLNVDDASHAAMPYIYIPHKPSCATLMPRSLIRACKVIMYANSLSQLDILLLFAVTPLLGYIHV